MIAFHVGLTKCASSTIQKFFASNRQALLDLSIDYPTIGLLNNTHRSFFYELKGSKEFDPSLGTLAELASYWRSAPSSTMVLSAEIFERLDSQEKIDEMRACLTGARPQEPVIVILITRPVGDRIVSTYSQNVKTGFHDFDFDTFFETRITRRLSYFDIAARWASSFGWDNLHVRPLVPSELVNGDIIDDFLSIIGVDLTDERLRGMSREGRRNVSPGWRVLEGVRALQDESHGLPENHPILTLVKNSGGRRTLGNLAMVVGENMGWNADKGRYLTHAQAEYCHVLYGSSVRELNKKLKTPLSLPQDLDASGFVAREFLPSAQHIATRELNEFYDRIAERWIGLRAQKSAPRPGNSAPAVRAEKPARDTSPIPAKAPKQKYRILHPGYNVSIVPHHIGNSAWTASGGLYAIRYPDKLMYAADGKVESLADFGNLPKASDYRCLFLDAAGNLFASRTRKQKAGGTSELLRSTDGGQSFNAVLPWCIWAMDQARGGALYAGTYEREGSACGCKVLKSIDGGVNWLDISPPDWEGQHHVHGLGIDPDTGWLYANLGDENGFDGCWRNRQNAVAVAEGAAAGSRTLTLPSNHGFAVDAPVLVHDHINLLRTTVSAVSDSTLTLSDPLPFALTAGAIVASAAWTHKFRNDEASLQFIDIVFKDGQIYLSDDTPIRSNPRRVVVWSAKDDGTDTPVAPEPALKAYRTGAKNFGAFFLRKAPDGRLWTGLRPRSAASFVWTSMDGQNWTSVVRCAKEGMKRWLETRSLRDATRTAVGDGRTLSGPGGALIVALGKGALYLSPLEK